VSHEAQVTAARDATVAALGRVDVLVCSAGITGPNLADGGLPARRLEAGARHQPHRVFLCNKALVPHMQKNDYGRIVNIASIAARKAIRTPPPTAPPRRA
jgi:3-oxoacyl-[acyl-carrier protein] reductase